MEKRIGATMLLAALLLLGPLAAGGEERSGFDQVVDFSVTLKTLAENADNPQAEFVRQGKFLILNGTVSNIRLLSPEPAGFRAEVELVLGEWAGLEEVHSYRAYVLFEGPQFYRQFPKKKSPSAPPQAIGVNDRVIVVARALELISVEPDRTDWLLRGYHIRALR